MPDAAFDASVSSLGTMQTPVSAIFRIIKKLLGFVISNDKTLEAQLE